MTTIVEKGPPAMVSPPAVSLTQAPFKKHPDGSLSNLTGVGSMGSLLALFFPLP